MAGDFCSEARFRMTATVATASRAARAFSLSVTADLFLAAGQGALGPIGQDDAYEVLAASALIPGLSVEHSHHIRRHAPDRQVVGWHSVRHHCSPVKRMFASDNSVCRLRGVVK
jgi:hypothetical protein